MPVRPGEVVTPVAPQAGKYNTYVGPRIVPIVLTKWKPDVAYEPLTVVPWKGSSYTSKTFVPAGITPDNKDFWVKTGDYNAKLEEYRQEVKNLSDRQDNFDQTLTNMGSEIDEIQQVDERQSADISALQTENENQQTAIDKNASDITAINEKNAEQDSEIADIKTKNDEQDTAIAGNAANIDRHESYITDIIEKNRQQDTRMDGLEDVIDTHTDSIGTINHEISDIKTEQTEQNSRLTDIEALGISNQDKNTEQDSRLDSIESLNETQQNEIDTNTTNIATINDKNSEQDNEIAGIKTVNQTQQTAIDQNTNNIININAAQQTQDTNIRNNATAISDIHDEQAIQNTKINQNTTDITANAGNIAKNTTDIAALTINESDHEALLAQHTTNINALRTDMTNVQTKQTTLETQVGTITSDVNSLETEIDTVDGRVGAVVATQNQQAATMTQIQTAISDLDGDVADYAARITAAQNTANSGVAKADAAQRTANTAVANAATNKTAIANQQASIAANTQFTEKFYGSWNRGIPYRLLIEDSTTLDSIWDIAKNLDFGWIYVTHIFSNEISYPNFMVRWLSKSPTNRNQNWGFLGYVMDNNTTNAYMVKLPVGSPNRTIINNLEFTKIGPTPARSLGPATIPSSSTAKQLIDFLSSHIGTLVTLTGRAEYMVSHTGPGGGIVVDKWPLDTVILIPVSASSSVVNGCGFYSMSGTTKFISFDINKLSDSSSALTDKLMLNMLNGV